MTDTSSSSDLTKYVCDHIRTACCNPAGCVCPRESKAEDRARPPCSSECCSTTTRLLQSSAVLPDQLAEEGMNLRELCLGAWNEEIGQAQGCALAVTVASSIKISCQGQSCLSNCGECAGFAVDPLTALYDREKCEPLQPGPIPMPDKFDSDVHSLCRIKIDAEGDSDNYDVCVGAVKKVGQRDADPQTYVCLGFKYRHDITVSPEQVCERTQVSPVNVWDCKQWTCAKDDAGEFETCNETLARVDFLDQPVIPAVEGNGALHIANYISYPQMNQCKRQFVEISPASYCSICRCTLDICHFCSCVCLACGRISACMFLLALRACFSHNSCALLRQQIGIGHR